MIIIRSAVADVDWMSFKASMSFLLQLAALSPELEETLAQERSSWAPEALPVTVTAAALARGVQHHANSFPPAILAAMFALCEEAIRNDGDEGNAFATGFLETLQNAAARNEFDFSKITAHLGKASKAHCVAMDKFYGAATPGL